MEDAELETMVSADEPNDDGALRANVPGPVPVAEAPKPAPKGRRGRKKARKAAKKARGKQRRKERRRTIGKGLKKLGQGLGKLANKALDAYMGRGAGGDAPAQPAGPSPMLIGGGLLAVGALGYVLTQRR